MPVHRLDHINIDTARLDETIAFYSEVLGLESRPKPSGNAGAWLYLGSQAVVHLNVVDHPREARTGAFNHVAFDATDVDGLVAALEAAGHPHSVSHRPDLGISQVLTADPNGVRVELNVPIADSAAASGSRS